MKNPNISIPIKGVEKVTLEYDPKKVNSAILQISFMLPNNETLTIPFEIGISKDIILQIMEHWFMSQEYEEV